MKMADIVRRLRRLDLGRMAKDPAQAIKDVSEAANEIEILRAERDEARREVCQLKSWNFSRSIDAHHYALLRKWDCFEVKR